MGGHTKRTCLTLCTTIAPAKGSTAVDTRRWRSLRTPSRSSRSRSQQMPQLDRGLPLPCSPSPKALASGKLTSSPARSAELVNKWLSYVESPLSGEFFLESGLSYVDFAYYMVFDVIALKQAAGKMEGVTVPEKLQKWYSETMPGVEGVATLKAAGVPMLPESFI